jgi:SAM-dependent methyltransferase
MLTRKDEMELHYWKVTENREYHRAKMALYLWAFGFFRYPKRVLEIGCGPFGGFLPLLDRAALRVGVDPLVGEYRRAGLLTDAEGITYVADHFETWSSSGRPGSAGVLFDAIFAADALDHGEMGFETIPRLAEILAPGGRLYVHVNLRPADRLNAIHDHSLTVAQLDAALDRAYAGPRLTELRREIFPEDIDGTFCESLVGVWERAV